MTWWAIVGFSLFAVTLFVLWCVIGVAVAERREYAEGEWNRARHETLAGDYRLRLRLIRATARHALEKQDNQDVAMEVALRDIVKRTRLGNRFSEMSFADFDRADARADLTRN